jgi:hypothetical protein
MLVQAAVAADSGYQSMSVRDFEIDAPKLVARHARVSLVGYYIGGGHAMLFDSQQDISMMRYASPPHVAFLIDNASRPLRARILACDSDPGAAQIGCRIEIKGRAQMCVLSFMGSTEPKPCINAEDGGAYTPPPPPPPTAAEIQRADAQREEAEAKRKADLIAAVNEWRNKMVSCLNRPTNNYYANLDLYLRCAGAAPWPQGAEVPNPLPHEITDAIAACLFRYKKAAGEGYAGEFYQLCTHNDPPRPPDSVPSAH